MAKRFTDTGKWDKAWFRRLSPKLKAAWLYLCDRCDSAGVWAVDMEMLSFSVGDHVDLEELLDNFDVEMLPKDKLWIRGFIQFQYGNELSDKSAPHRSVISLVKKHGLPIPINGEIPEAAIRRPVPARLRERIFQVHGNRCSYCGETGAIHIEHIIPVAKGGTNEEENLTTACERCNSTKGTKDVFEFLSKHVPGQYPACERLTDKLMADKFWDNLVDKDGNPIPYPRYPSGRVVDGVKEKEQLQEKEKVKEKEQPANAADEANGIIPELAGVDDELFREMTPAAQRSWVREFGADFIASHVPTFHSAWLSEQPKNDFGKLKPAQFYIKNCLTSEKRFRARNPDPPTLEIVQPAAPAEVTQEYLKQMDDTSALAKSIPDDARKFLGQIKGAG